MSATPPTPPPRYGTPIHTRSATTDRYVPRYQNRNTILSRLANEMYPFVVGPISADAFLNSFMPPPPVPLDSSFAVGMFDDLINRLHEPEIHYYKSFVRSDPLRLFSYLIFPFQNGIVSHRLRNLTIKNTSGATDQAPRNRFPFHLKPDCSVYANCEGMEKAPETYLNLSCVDFVIEFKRNLESDPFADSLSEQGVSSPFACPEGRALTILGQLTAYATSILSAQYRTHTFMIFIVKDYARLIRWDRSGAVFTHPIYFNDESHLMDFFTRYDIADREARGHDTTVSSASLQDVAIAQANVPELGKANNFLDVTISDQHFIIPSPESTPDIPVGRWTRASFAYDKHNGRRVLLKDSWRVLLEGIKPEGDIYRLLHEKRVPNIPSYTLADDVGNEIYHRTRTDAIVDDQNFELRNHRPRWKLTSHRHYRIVLHTVGKKLENFSCTQEFVKAMLAALRGKIIIFLAVRPPNLTHIIAHEAAYEAGVLHRDTVLAPATY